MFRGDSTYLYSYLRKSRQGRSQGFPFFYDYYDDLWMSVVYEKLLLLIVAAATKWRVVAFLIDIYMYISKT